MDATSYLSTAAVAQRLIGEPVVAQRWAEDSALDAEPVKPFETLVR